MPIGPPPRSSIPCLEVLAFPEAPNTRPNSSITEHPIAPTPTNLVNKPLLPHSFIAGKLGSRAVVLVVHQFARSFAMATTALGSQVSLLPSCAAHFSRTLHESCNPSSVSVRAALQRCKTFKPRSSSSALRASSTASWSSASSSFQGRLCLVLTCPNGEWRERRRSGVRASLLGVGAPEALVIGVVALLVFGPKGLAEVARTLGKSLRAFQPTIKELQQVSREFKATLEQEIGLDEIRSPSSNDSLPKSRSRPNSVSPTSMPSTLEAPPSAPKTEDGPAQPKPYTTEDYVRITEDQTNALVTEEQRKASAAAAWGGSPPVENGAEASSEGQADTSPDSSSNESSETSQVGSTPTEPIGNPTGNGSPKP